VSAPRNLVAVALTLLSLAAGAALAVASGGGASGGESGTAQYGVKPGCGPDKTDGVAGASGSHSGQPPKDEDRGDCPNPPGQNK
jgi:hypothetical protein